jgi:hypothetical protein
MAVYDPERTSTALQQGARPVQRAIDRPIKFAIDPLGRLDREDEELLRPRGCHADPVAGTFSLFQSI